MRIEFKEGKSEQVRELYSEMLDILKAVGIPVDELPSDRRREKMAGACLAAGQIYKAIEQICLHHYDASAKIRIFFETQMYLDFFLSKKD